ncbi:hypothetical protein R1flu_019376 [Riccia fluitans]|uniref:Uncharacterized protein n=1 Tax=Riccia fluitans TaxID=41844 RepID=A0ABD1ZII0_9MARC
MMVAFEIDEVIQEEMTAVRVQPLYADCTGERRHSNHNMPGRNCPCPRGGRLQSVRQSEERRPCPRSTHWLLQPDVARAAPAA